MIELNTAPITSLDDLAARIKNPFQVKINPLGDKGRDFPHGFQITEFVQGVAQTPLTLAGNMMPMIPFEWGGEQRLVKDYYPGNPEPAVQMLGPKESTVPVKGRFKDKKYRDTTWYGVAYQMSVALDEVRKRGNILKIAMYGESGSWVRYAVLENTKWKMEKLGWIDYELDFFVISESMPRNNFFASASKDTPQAVNQALIAAVAAWQQTVRPITVPRSISDVLNGLISDVATQINKVTNFVDAAIGTVEGIVASGNRALGLIKNARTSLSKFRRRAAALGVMDFAELSSETNAARQAAAAYRNLAYLHSLNGNTISLSQYLAKIEAQIRAITVTLPQARYKVTQGDTLQNVSMRFYGNADGWQRIFDHNKLTTTTLTGGQVLEIPHL